MPHAKGTYVSLPVLLTFLSTHLDNPIVDSYHERLYLGRRDRGESHLLLTSLRRLRRLYVELNVALVSSLLPSEIEPSNTQRMARTVTTYDLARRSFLDSKPLNPAAAFLDSARLPTSKAATSSFNSNNCHCVFHLQINSRSSFSLTTPQHPSASYKCDAAASLETGVSWVAFIRTT